MKFLIKSGKYGNVEVEIDAEDYDKIKKFTWYISSNGKRYGKELLRVRTDIYAKGKHHAMYLHKFLVPFPKVKFIDGNFCNCRKSNLRKGVPNNKGNEIVEE